MLYMGDQMHPSQMIMESLSSRDALNGLIFLDYVLFINPISHEYGALWPTPLESVHHFHRFWTKDTIILDFMSTQSILGPSKANVDIFFKYLRYLALK